MPDPMAGLPPRFLRTPEAARYLGLSGRTLEKHRTYGTGPTYRKIGGRVVYALDDLKAWADLGAKTSTSDPGKGHRTARQETSAPAPAMRAGTPLIAARAMAMRRKRLSEREQLELFRALARRLRAARRAGPDGLSVLFARQVQARRRRSIFAQATIAIRVEAVPEHGMATIWDADVLIWAASQIVEARDAGLKTSRLMAATPYEILTFVGRGTARATTND